MTDSILPTNSETLPPRVSTHSSWARSTSKKSPSAKLLPVRGTKFTLTVPSTLSPIPEERLRLISLAMKPGAPCECTLSKRSTPAASPRSATSPRELMVGASRSPRKTQPYWPWPYCGNILLPLSRTMPEPSPCGTKKPKST